MKKTLIYLSVAVLFGAGNASWAQDDTTTEAETTTTAADEEFPVGGEKIVPQPGQIYVREEHGSWEIRCVKGEEGATTPELCRLYQLLLDEEGASVAEINLQRLPEGGEAAAGVDFVSPLGTLLTQQVTLRIDAGKSRRYPFSWCDQYGCYARFGLSAEDVDSLRRGNTANATIVAVAAKDDPLKLTISLAGFTAGWNALEP